MEARAVRRICVLGVAVVALAGCGGGGKSDTTSSSATTTPTVTEDSSLAAQVPAVIRQAGTIKVATNVPFPPGELYAPNGTTVIGFDPELMNAIAGVLGLKAEFLPTRFERVLPNVENGTATVGASSVTDTKGREKTVQFVTYLKPGEAFLTKPGGPRIAVPHDMCGHKIGAIEHTVEEEHIFEVADRCHPEGRAKITLTAFQHIEEEAVPALLDGQIELLYADAPALEYQQRKLGSKVTVAPAHFVREPYGFVLAQNSGLAQPMVEALKVLMKNGTYAAILKHWHVEGDAISEPVIDGAIR